MFAGFVAARIHLFFLLAIACSAYTSCRGDSGTAPRHLILVTVDTLRADRLGAYGYPGARTPHLDALAGESIRFERGFAHASITLPSTASLLTGVLPARHGLLGNVGTLPGDVATLSERLSRAGFATAAFIGNYALRSGRGLERGFDTYTERFLIREVVRRQPENPGAMLTDQAVAWLRARDEGRRFFLWVHYQEPHGPYTPAEFEKPESAVGPVLARSATNSGRGAIPDYQWLGHGRVAEYLARYDGEVAEVDRQLGRLLRALRDTGVLDESLLVFTADHGEAFGEEDLYLAHGEGLSEALIRVPLLLRLPGGGGSVRADVVRLIDVVPTALGSLGLDAGGLPGESLLEEGAERVVAAQIEPYRKALRWRSVRRGDYELYETRPGKTLLRDLGAGGATLPEGAHADLRAALAAELEALAPWRNEAPTVELTPEEEEALRALGYLD